MGDTPRGSAAVSVPDAGKRRVDPYVLDVQGWPFAVWESWVSLCILYACIELPLELVFQDLRTRPALIYLVDAFLFLDVLVRFRTCTRWAQTSNTYGRSHTPSRKALCHLVSPACRQHTWTGGISCKTLGASQGAIAKTAFCSISSPRCRFSSRARFLPQHFVRVRGYGPGRRRRLPPYTCSSSYSASSPCDAS